MFVYKDKGATPGLLTRSGTLLFMLTFRYRKITFPRSTFVMTCKSVIYNVV